MSLKVYSPGLMRVLVSSGGGAFLRQSKAFFLQMGQQTVTLTSQLRALLYAACSRCSWREGAGSEVDALAG